MTNRQYMLLSGFLAWIASTGKRIYTEGWDPFFANPVNGLTAFTLLIITMIFVVLFACLLEWSEKK